MTAGGSRPLRVALVIGQLTHGGAERQLYELARRLPAHGVQPVVISLSPAVEPYGPMLEASGVPVHFLQRSRRFELRRMRRLASLLCEERIDLVHAFLLVASLYARGACALARTPRFLPSVRSMEVKRSRALHLLDGHVLRRAPLVLVNSSGLGEWAGRHYRIPAERIRVVPNGLDLERFAQIPPLSAERSRAAVVGSVSLFKPVKRISFLLEVARQVGRLRPGTRFRLVGDGAQMAEIRRLCRDGLADMVSLPGETRDVPAEMSGFDIFVLASENEGMPNAVLEAMAAGRPVVGTDVPGIAEVVRHGVTGLLAHLDRPEAFVAALVDLIDHPDRAAEFGRAGRRRVEREYSADAMVSRTVAVYEELSG